MRSTVCASADAGGARAARCDHCRQRLLHMSRTGVAGEYRRTILTPSSEGAKPPTGRSVIRRLIPECRLSERWLWAEGTFRVRGDVLELQPADEEIVTRVEFFGDEVEENHVSTGDGRDHPGATDHVYPASSLVTPTEGPGWCMLREIDSELNDRPDYSRRKASRLLEAQRLEQRTRYDMRDDE